MDKGKKIKIQTSDLIYYWTMKLDSIEKSAALLLFDPENQKKYLDAIPFIEETIKQLKTKTP